MAENVALECRGGGSRADLKGLEMQVAKVVLMALAASALNVQAATVVVSGGTTMLQSASGEEKRLSSLRVDCASYNRTNVGYLCGFDDGQHTILQFEEQEGKPVRLYDAEGNEILGVRRIGSYHVLPKLYRMVFARVGNKEAAIVRDVAGGPGYAVGATPSAPVANAAPVAGNAAPVRSVPVQPATSAAITAAPVSGAAVAATPSSAASRAVRPDQAKRDWVLKTSHTTLEEALEEFAARIDYELVYENRELLLNLKRDMPIARNADFWEMLTLLGEAYRKSDAPFQIIPTEYKQIVVVPMGQENTAAAQR